jgi:hypothetical protein
MSNRSTRAALGLAFLILLPLPAAASWPTDPLVNLPVCVASGNQNPAVIASDASHGAFIAWTDARIPGDYPKNLDIYVQHVLASGVVDPLWPANGLPACVADSAQQSPQIVGDGSGGAIVVWEDFRTGASVVYAQHVLASGTVDPGWPVNGSALYTSGFEVNGPRAVADGAGGAVVAWMDYRNGNQDIYAQRVLASGAVDPAWPADGRALCTAPNDQWWPRMVADGAGGAIVTWQDYRGDGDIYAQRVLADGTFGLAWPVDGLSVCTAVNGQFTPTIVGDGAGGAIVTWSDFRNGDGDIYSQHVLAGGNVDPAWPVDGRALCLAANDQSNPVIVTDGAAGAIVAWEDFRTGFPAYDIYAQRVLWNGTIAPAWPADGRAMCAAVDRQLTPAIVTDGASGAIVTWADYRIDSYPTNADVYAQRVLASGVVDPAWPGDGRAISTAASLQLDPAIVTDGAGGAILAWWDVRNLTDADIYSQRVQSSGLLGGDAPTATLFSLVSAEADGEGVKLEWFTTAGASTSARVYRRTPDTGWSSLSSVQPDGTGAIRYRDAVVEPGVMYGYRLGISTTAGDRYSGVAWVRAFEGHVLALDGLRPNPADRELAVSLSLPDGERAVIELVDLAGRVVARREIVGQPGNHLINLRDGGDVEPGVYFVRLTHGGSLLTRKACVVH